MSQPQMTHIELENSASPTGRAHITAERFISPVYMAQEWEKIWTKAWLVAGVEQDLQEPGDYFVFNLSAESIIVSRTHEGEVAAMYNVCQHRGARVLVNNFGTLDNFVCPYHRWTYSPGGELMVVPDTDRFSQGVDCEKLSLKRLRVECWAGLVWVCMDDGAPTLTEFLGPIQELVDPFRLEDMSLAVDQTVSLDCNWKAVIDNFGELYHVEHIHPQHATIFDCPSATTELMAGGHNRVLIDGFTVNSHLPIPDEPTMTMVPQMQALGMDPKDYKGRVLDVRRDIQIKKRELGPSLGYNYDRLTDEQLSDIVQYNIFPNIIVAIQTEELWVMRSRPHETDPNKCYWDKFTMRMAPDDNATRKVDLTFNVDQVILEGVPERPEHEDFIQDDVIAGKNSMTITIDQDVHLIRDVQAGMHSRGFNEAWLNDDENRVQHFHNWMDYYMSVD